MFLCRCSASNSKYNRTIFVQVDEEIKAIIDNNLSAKFAALKSSPPVDLSIISAQSHGMFQLSKARRRFNGSDSSHSLSVLDG
ncbi:hypothetical protein ACFX15_009256 [Malus domestica]